MWVQPTDLVPSSTEGPRSAAEKLSPKISESLRDELCQFCKGDPVLGRLSQGGEFGPDA